VAVKIRLLRMGKIRNPQYRIVVADSRTKRDGRAIEYVGIYQPKEDPSIIQVKSERVQYWLSVGAQPSEAVQRILEKTGDWQQFKGLPAPPPLLMKAEKVSRLATYEAEAKAAAGVADAPSAKPAKRAAKATEAKADKADKVEADKVDTRTPAAPEVAETRPSDTKAVDPAEPNREAVAADAKDPAGAGADAN
jgi:small subunit ribosomal protein S16